MAASRIAAAFRLERGLTPVLKNSYRRRRAHAFPGKRPERKKASCLFSRAEREGWTPLPPGKPGFRNLGL